MIKHWKFNNAAEMQRPFRKEFKSFFPTRLKIAKIRNKFGDDGTIQNVHNQRSGRSRSSTKPTETL